MPWVLLTKQIFWGEIINPILTTLRKNWNQHNIYKNYLMGLFGYYLLIYNGVISTHLCLLSNKEKN
jgi:hypothetical protein